MWPDITPLLQQLKNECSDKDWLITGYVLDCPLASVDLGTTRLQSINAENLLQRPFTERYAAALMLIEEQQDKQILELCISRLRDVLAERVLVVTPQHNNYWSTAKMLGFGFKRIAEPTGWQVWGFDIHTYKEVPDWLNAKFWANPQNWGKYWW
ncbi:DUF6231 family protein [Agitococcus lubricus]|uniref:Uncharacterized protein n=1 Tax=Agitococcus lubricus TaxID=1077255 RepID=A0A2T5IZR2_9GAMM|nr:DUF6231 family protein [Agitococcus lubricus]PTQ89560.1 hypothetical protein C8N29_10691 [Agitococcus lubricus]